MKNKDLVYIGIIAYLAYLLLKKKKSGTQTEAQKVTTESTAGGATAGNASNGGLNLGKNMDLPSLTPTASNGLSTEVALNSSNVSPLVKDDNEPTQIFGAQLPAGLPQYGATSVINPNPLNIGATESSSASTTQPATASTIETPNASTQPATASTIETPNASTKDYATVPTTQTTTKPITPTPFVPKKTYIYQQDISPSTTSLSVLTTPPATSSTTNIKTDLVTETAVIPKRKVEDILIKNTDISQNAPIVTLPPSPTPVATTKDYQAIKTVLPTATIGSSAISEPVFTVTPTKSIPTVETISGGTKAILPEPVKDQIISQCGNSFSIPNNDKEGSYTNYWYDGTNFYMQTTSPMVKTVATKITKDSFVEGCRKLQSYQMQQTK
jgi:hypothetical protein